MKFLIDANMPRSAARLLRELNRFVFNFTSKPPGTIEWE
jgi:GMP synthase PP-ATPase subunit